MDQTAVIKSDGELAREFTANIQAPINQMSWGIEHGGVTSSNIQAKDGNNSAISALGYALMYSRLPVMTAAGIPKQIAEVLEQVDAENAGTMSDGTD